MQGLKVALVHDYIKEYGGAERVLEVLHEIFPEAPVYTSVYIPRFLGTHRERFRGWDIRTSWLQFVPFKEKLISPFRLVSPWVFGGFDLSGFDVVIVSATGAYFPNMVRTKRPHPHPLLKGEGRKGRAVQICYCHTPPRYLYGYATARDWRKHKFWSVLAGLANHFLRMLDFETSKRVDYYVANSEEVAGRIRKFYRREAAVIYPPAVSELRITNYELRDKKEYFLTGGRLARAKRVELIVSACRELGVSLKVFGRGFAGYENELRITNYELRDGEVEFLGEVSEEEKWELMRGAKAFIFAGEDEDFGIVPVEAMGAGLPVIAYKSGGVKETVVDGKTGVFFEELSMEGLRSAMMRFEKMKFDSRVCMERAEMFSKERFVREMEGFVDEVIEK